VKLSRDPEDKLGPFSSPTATTTRTETSRATHPADPRSPSVVHIDNHADLMIMHRDARVSAAQKYAAGAGLVSFRGLRPLYEAVSYLACLLAERPRTGDVRLHLSDVIAHAPGFQPYQGALSPVAAFAM
jgi:hypothetical protein